MIFPFSFLSAPGNCLYRGIRHQTYHEIHDSASKGMKKSWRYLWEEIVRQKIVIPPPPQKKIKVEVFNMIITESVRVISWAS